MYILSGAYSYNPGSVNSGNLRETNYEPPMNVVPRRYLNVCRPYGYTSLPPSDTVEMVIDDTVVGQFDNREIHTKLKIGEAYMQSDNFTLGVHNDSIQAHTEDWKVHLAQAENTKELMTRMFEFMDDLTKKLESLTNWINNHNHYYFTSGGGTAPTTAPTAPSPVSGASYRSSPQWQSLSEGEDFNQDDYLFIKEGKEPINDGQSTSN